MMDEKKIEEVANEYANRDWISDDCCLAYEDGFKAGINWFLGNIWHDAKERPTKDKLIFVERKDAYGNLVYDKMFAPATFMRWNRNVGRNDYTRWLYIDDLLKGGK